jgi:hypothetical protein
MYCFHCVITEKFCQILVNIYDGISITCKDLKKCLHHIDQFRTIITDVYNVRNILSKQTVYW